MSMLLSQQGLWSQQAFWLMCFILTVFAHGLARLIGRYYPRVPIVITATGLIILALTLLKIPYLRYFAALQPFFDHLLGYITVTLAIPLASMPFAEFKNKKLIRLFILATLMGALFPMLLAFIFVLPLDTILAFASRAVTTPLALNIAALIHAPATLASLIVIVSGVLGAACAPFLLKSIEDERAAGLAMGLAAHAIGTVEAWQRSATAGRYAVLGMTLNGILTTLWLPLVVHFVYFLTNVT